jgi:hypothetical protein
MMNPPSSDEESTTPWLDYIHAEIELLMEQAGKDLVIAMIHSRAIEQPTYYSKQDRKKDIAKAMHEITKAGYWERVALRALVLLKVPIEVREKLIEEALERETAAKKASAKRVKGGPGGPYKPVDLSQIEL